MSSSGIPFPHSIPKGLTEQPVLSHGGFGTHRDRVEAPAVPRAWGLAQYHQDKVPQHLRILSASLWGCVGANLKQAFHHTACKMGILIKGIESQSCTSIIPGEWGSGKNKKPSKELFNFFNFQDFQYPGTASSNKWDESSILCYARRQFFKLSVNGCARCWSLFSIHPLAVQGRNESHWKEGSSQRMKEKPTLACNDKSCSLIQHCCRASCSCPASKKKRFDSQSLFSPLFTDIDLYENGF